MRRFMVGTALIVVLMALAVEGYYVLQFYGDAKNSEAVQNTTGTEATTTSQPVNGSSSGQPSMIMFVHKSTASNTTANSTYIDSPLTNGRPDLLLSVTQNWNPGGESGVYNDHPVGVWYDGGRKKWAVFNQDRARMTQGAAFNVLVSSESTPFN